MKLFGNTSHKNRAKPAASEPVKEKPVELEETKIVEPVEPEEVKAAGPAVVEDTPERTPEEKQEIEAMIARYQKKKMIRRFIILGVLVVIALGVFIFVKATVKPPVITDDPGLNVNTPTPTIEVTVTPTPTVDVTAEPTDSPEPTESPEPSDEPVVPVRKEGFYTFALIGMDQQYGNTDTILIGSYDDVNKTLDFVSIPRDTMVNVPWDVKKVNTIYSYSVRYGLADDKIEGFKAGMRDFTGFTIDNVILVNMRGFVNLVDTIGGVYFDVPVSMNYDDPIQDLHIHVSKGYQYLNGTQAVGVMRFRNNNDGSGYFDTGRIETQQKFLKAIAKQCISTISISKINDYAKIFKESVTTDLTVGNLVWYGEKLLALDPENIRFHTLPSEVNDTVKGLSYGTVYVDDWIDMINAYLNPYNVDITVENVNLLSRPNIKDEHRSNWGEVYATSGVISGGYESFYDVSAHSSSSSSSSSGSGTSTEPDNGGDTGGDDSGSGGDVSEPDNGGGETSSGQEGGTSGGDETSP